MLAHVTLGRLHRLTRQALAEPAVHSDRICSLEMLTQPVTGRLAVIQVCS
jgi:hypothetical protein